MSNGLKTVIESLGFLTRTLLGFLLNNCFGMAHKVRPTQARLKQFCIVLAERGGAVEEEVGGSSSSSHPLELNAMIPFSNSADMQRWQNTEQTCCTAIKSGKGEGCKGRGSRCFTLEIFSNY